MPPETKFSIVEASIEQFNLTSNNTLYYNFKVIVTATNFDTRIKSYDQVIAIGDLQLRFEHRFKLHLKIYSLSKFESSFDFQR
jgi:hypothetical protein